PGERLIIVARRGDDGLAHLPMRHGGLPDGTRLRDLLSGVETSVQGGWLPLAGLPAVGAQIWQVQG
ncbi:MAG: maltodextrin glucosidase, partial [Chloroflexaceae bacterium]